MDQLLEAIFLGMVQGIAEWLPISSTAHLRLTELFLGLRLPILFDVTLHAGTLAVIFVFFRHDIRNILTALVHADFKTEYGRLIPLILVGSIPTAMIGLFLGEQIESVFSNAVPIAAALMITGMLLFTSKMAREKTDTISYRTALVFGLAQGIAIVPGISRSGTTIAVALLLGLRREKAFRFSFLLSVPAIVGALGLTAFREHADLSAAGVGVVEVLAGTVVAMVVGFFALKLLWRSLQKERFYLFAFYCWILGIATLTASLVAS